MLPILVLELGLIQEIALLHKCNLWGDKKFVEIFAQAVFVAYLNPILTKKLSFVGKRSKGKKNHASKTAHSKNILVKDSRVLQADNFLPNRLGDKNFT